MSISDDEPFFFSFEELLKYMDDAVQSGELILPNEFLEKSWDEDVALIAAQIASLSDVDVKTVLFTILRIYMDAPEALDFNSIEEYLNIKKAGSN